MSQDLIDKFYASPELIDLY